MRHSTLLFTAAAALLLGISFSCSKSGNKAGTTTTTTNGDSILVNIGNNIILPGYQSLAAAANSLDSAIGDFNTSPTSTKLTNIQNLFEATYIAWQSVSEYNYFGPAYSAQPVLSTLNVFPTSTAVIDSNINNGNDDVNTFANTAAKGFPALDYLLFGAGGSPLGSSPLATNGAILANYTSDAQAANRQKYLAAVSADIKAETNAALTTWSANYINTFISGSGNSVSSSLGLLINSMDEDFEILKNDRLGIPLGLIPVGVVSPVLPKEVEAYYSGISSQLALAQLKAVQHLYQSLIPYLTNAKATYNGGPLSDTITAAFTADITALRAVPDPLSQTIQTNPAGAQAAFAASQKLVALLKTDMPSSLGVLITYGDNDGD